MNAGLQECLDDLKTKQCMVLASATHGCTLQEDGIKVLRRNTLNTVANFHDLGEIVVQSTYTKGAIKSGPFICNDLIQAVEKLSNMGPGYIKKHRREPVDIVVIDGTNTNANALTLFAKKYPYIWSELCTTHGINLSGKDLIIIFKEPLKLVQRLLAFVINHDVVFHAFLDTKSKILSTPAATRAFGT